MNPDAVGDDPSGIVEQPGAVARDRLEVSSL